MQNYTESVQSGRMTPEELIKAREALGFGQSDLARALKTPLRTYQDWEAGTSKIPGVVQIAVALYSERDRWLMQEIVTEAVTEAVKEYPRLFKINRRPLLTSFANPLSHNGEAATKALE